MIAQHDPWAHRENGWSSALAAQSESLLALSNGYLGVRGTLDEGAPGRSPLARRPPVLRPEAARSAQPDIAFPFAFQGRVVRVEIMPRHASYELQSGTPIKIEHWGTPLSLIPDARTVAAIPPAPELPAFRQPAGRAPRRRQSVAPLAPALR